MKHELVRAYHNTHARMHARTHSETQRHTLTEVHTPWTHGNFFSAQMYLSRAHTHTSHTQIHTHAHAIHMKTHTKYTHSMVMQLHTQASYIASYIVPGACEHRNTNKKHLQAHIMAQTGRRGIHAQWQVHGQGAEHYSFEYNTARHSWRRFYTVSVCAKLSYATDSW